MIWSRNRGWIGVDLGSHTVKLAQLQKRGGAIQLADALIVRRQQPWTTADDGADLEPANSDQELQAGLSLGAGFAGRSAAAVLTMSVCDVRECRLAADSEEVLGNQLARELGAAYPGGLDSRELGYWPVDLPGAAPPSTENLISLSIDQAWGFQVAKDLSRAGLRGQVLDGLPLALARAVKLSGQAARNKSVVVVDWGSQRTTLCAVVDGYPYFVRCLRGPGFARMIDVLCESLSVTREEAQKLLADYGLPSRNRRDQDDLQAVIEEVTAELLNSLIDELTRTVHYLNQQRRQLFPSKLILFGGGASIKNLPQVLTDKLEIPTETWRLPDAALQSTTLPQLSIELLGPAIALSSLAWGR